MYINRHVYQVDDVRYRPQEIYLHVFNPSINYPMPFIKIKTITWKIDTFKSRGRLFICSLKYMSANYVHFSPWTGHCILSLWKEKIVPYCTCLISSKNIKKIQIVIPIINGCSLPGMNSLDLQLIVFIIWIICTSHVIHI